MHLDYQKAYNSLLGLEKIYQEFMEVLP
jgi:hypothetical protein